jgi:hypothetical protein
MERCQAAPPPWVAWSGLPFDTSSRLVDRSHTESSRRADERLVRRLAGGPVSCGDWLPNQLHDARYRQRACARVRRTSWEAHPQLQGAGAPALSSAHSPVASDTQIK